MEVILPVLDKAALQEKANEYAMKGVIETFKDFYTGYNSPYRKAIEDDLKKKDIGYHLQLPDVIGIINDALSTEIDQIANAAIAKSFVPLVQRFLVREDKEVLFSKILLEFIKHVDDDNLSNYSVDIKTDSHYGWITITIENIEKDIHYKFTLHQSYKNKEMYSLLSLPYNSDNKQMMKVSLDGVTLELPFVSGILQNSFLSYMSRLIIGECQIKMDVYDFDECMIEEYKS